jgi:hypothetical protein
MGCTCQDVTKKHRGKGGGVPGGTWFRRRTPARRPKRDTPWPHNLIQCNAGEKKKGVIVVVVAVVVVVVVAVVVIVVVAAAAAAAAAAAVVAADAAATAFKRQATKAGMRATSEVDAVSSVWHRVWTHERKASFERVRVQPFAIRAIHTPAPQNERPCLPFFGEDELAGKTLQIHVHAEQSVMLRPRRLKTRGWISEAGVVFHNELQSAMCIGIRSRQFRVADLGGSEIAA